MNQTVECEFLLYVDDLCLVYQHEVTNKEIKQNLNKNVSKLLWVVVDNKLSIHFGDDTKQKVYCLGQNMN